MLLSLPCLAVCAGLTMAAPPDSEGWTPLFNGRDLSGWYTFLQGHGRGPDPTGIVSIDQGAIHLYKGFVDGSKVAMGYLATEKEYGDYRLRLQYRWGPKKFRPRHSLKRDAGVYYHLTGPDAVWPRALQYQIEETNVGDMLALFGMRVDTWIDPKTLGAKPPEYPAFLPADRGGVPRVLGISGIDYQHRLTGAVEREGWNDVEIIARGTETIHLLNGRMVNRGVAARLDDPEHVGSPVPIRKGRVALEIQAAEVWYRNIEIRPAP